MRYLFVVVAIFAMSYAGIAVAQDDAKSAATQGAVEKPIVVDSNDAPAGDDDGFEDRESRRVPPAQVYDENTGIPNVVESDKEGEIGW
ncbi:MAG: hypothetical protein PHS46_00280 [Candidatus Omnitrophica bacterium]|jgi:hypothetical protein|nr:hypothetical protein [Candidatus Omnitrophota bacterium]